MTNELSHPVRVLHIVGSMGRGGIQSFLMNFYRNIDREKVQFDFLIHIPSENSFENEIRKLGGKIYNEKMPGLSSLHGYRRRISRFLEEHGEYQLVHIHVRTVAAMWTYIARKENRISIVHSHNTTNGYGMSAHIKDILQYPVRWLADYFMGCSNAANEWMFGKRIAHSDRCYVLKNGIEVERFRFDENKRKQIREELGISSNTIVLGNVGRLVEQKNQMLLLDVIKKLNEKDTKYLLIIVGDGPLRNKLEQKIHELGIENHTKLLGSRSDVNELLSAFDIFLMPSRNEGLGIAAIEAQAAGLQVLCSDAIPDDALITEKCVRVSSNDSERWVEAIMKMGKAKDRGAENEKIIEAGYDIKKVAEGGGKTLPEYAGIQEVSVSVIIPTYNGYGTIQRTIDSVLSQDVDKKIYEIIVVDDNNPGTEGRRRTEEIIAKYHSIQNLIYIKQPQNGERSRARNKGIEYSHGKYVMFLDDDDEFLPSKIRDQLEFMECHGDEYSCCYSNYIDVNMDGKISMRGAECREGYLLEEVLKRNMFVHPGSNLMVRRSEIERVGLFNTSISMNEDIEFLARLLKDKKIGYVNVEGLIVHRNKAKHKKRDYIGETVVYLNTIDPLMMELSASQRERINRHIGLHLCRGEFMNRNFRSIPQIAKRYDIRAFELIQYVIYLMQRRVKRKSYGFNPKYISTGRY